MTANASGSSTPERDDAAQPESVASSSIAATPPDTSPGGRPTVTVSEPRFGSLFDRIPVHKVSPVIEGGAYPAKAAVGESIPIRATVFREGHDAVNASVVLTDPAGNERREPMRPTTPLGFDWWTASVVLDTEGTWTFRVEGWSDPWETWVHTAEIKIPAGIDVALVCAEGNALFDKAAADAEAAGDYSNGSATAGCGQEPRLGTAGRGPARGRAGRRRPGRHDALRSARAGLADPGLPDLRRSAQSAVRLVVRVLPALPGGEVGRGEPEVDLGHLRLLPRAARGRRGDGLRRGLPPADPSDRPNLPAKGRTTP